MKTLRHVGLIKQKFMKYSGILSKPNTTPISETFSDKAVDVCHVTIQGWRGGNDDKYIVDLNVPNTNNRQIRLFAIFDGHASDAVSTFCSMKYIEILTSSDSFKKENYPQALQETNLSIDQLLAKEEVQKYLQTIGNGSGPIYSEFYKIPLGVLSGTTANVVMIVDTVLFCSNCGDSRSLLIQNNDIIQLSKDHKLNLEEECERIKAAGAEIIEGRVNGELNMSRCIGDLKYKNNTKLPLHQQAVTSLPDVTVRQITPQDKYIAIACDGVWDVLSNINFANKLVEYHKKEMPLEQITIQLCLDCIAQDMQQSSGYDNTSLILVKIK